LFKLRKVQAKVLSLALASTVILSACGGNDPSLQMVMKSEGYQVTAGMYLAFMAEAFSAAKEKVGGEHNHQDDVGHNDDNYLDVLTAEVEGKNGRQWIIDEAIKSSKLHFAVKRESSKRGITLVEDEKEAIIRQAEAQFDYFEEYYSKNGIGEQSLIELLENKKLYEKNFDKVYGGNGEKAVQNDEINKYDDENYDKIVYMALSQVSGDDEEAKRKNADLENMVKDMTEKVNDGSDFETEAKNILNKTADITGNTAPSGEQDISSDVFVDRKNYSTLFDKDFTEQIVNTGMNQASYKIKDNTIYIYEKIGKTEEDRTERREDMRRLFKDDTFINELLDKYKNFYIEVNQEAIDFYIPDKIKNVK